jgi:hypothetical protein
MLRSADLFVDRQRTLAQGQRSRQVALVLQQAGDVVERRRGRGIVRAADLLVEGRCSSSSSPAIARAMRSPTSLDGRVSIAPPTPVFRTVRHFEGWIIIILSAIHITDRP